MLAGRGVDAVTTTRVPSAAVGWTPAAVAARWTVRPAATWDARGMMLPGGLVATSRLPATLGTSLPRPGTVGPASARHLRAVGRVSAAGSVLAGLDRGASWSERSASLSNSAHGHRVDAASVPRGRVATAFSPRLASLVVDAPWDVDSPTSWQVDSRFVSAGAAAEPAPAGHQDSAPQAGPHPLRPAALGTSIPSGAPRVGPDISSSLLTPRRDPWARERGRAVSALETGALLGYEDIEVAFRGDPSVGGLRPFLAGRCQDESAAGTAFGREALGTLGLEFSAGSQWDCRMQVSQSFVNAFRERVEPPQFTLTLRRRF